MRILRVFRLFQFGLLALVLALALVMAGCGAKTTPTPLPTLALENNNAAPAKTSPAGVVTASGELAPVRQVSLGFSAAGVVAEVLVKEGDTVRTGQTLASLGNLQRLQTTLQASQKALLSAQKDLDNLNNGAALNLANADLAVVTAQKTYDDAVKHPKVKDFHRCSDDTIDMYFQILEDAQKRLQNLQDHPESRGITDLQKLTAAQNEVDTANANYLYCIRYTDEEIAQSNAEIDVAQAALNQAKARQDLLKQSSGVDPLELARLTSAVSSAQVAVVNAQTVLEQSTLLSPVAGTVASLDLQPGQAVLPGQALVVVASLDEYQAETTDLSEKDVARVRVGQSAQVSVEALGTEIPGKVVRITPKATKVGGDVVFRVIVQLDQQPDGMLWGMSVKVDIQP